MNKLELENIILKQLYELWETERGSSVYYVFQHLENVEEKVFDRVAHELVEKNLITSAGHSTPCDLTCYGIQETEKRELLDFEKLNRYQHIRYETLNSISKVYEIEGSLGQKCFKELIKENNFNEPESWANFRFMSELGLINGLSCCYQSTPEGLELFSVWEKEKFIKDKFNEISNLKPQPRGKELEKLTARIAEFSGWKQEENVMTSYEQIDVVIHQNLVFYLIECKWEKDKIEAGDIDKLFGKLSRRAGTNGILISMSGFSKGCVEAVKAFTNQKLILLFGKEDMKEIIKNPNSFDTLLNEKQKELVMRRSVIWK